MSVPQGQAKPDASNPTTSFFGKYLERVGARIPKRRRPATVKLVFPSTCSIFDDPESTLEVLTKIAQAVAGGARKLWFDQEGSVNVDLCAEALTAALAKEARLEKIEVNGEYPKEPDARSCVAGFGTPAVLKEFGYEPTWDIPLLPLERYNSVSRPDTKLLLAEERASRVERIPVLIEEQFGDRVMTLQFGDRLIQFLLAAIDNAVEHGSGDWWIASSFRKLADPDWGKCQIVIFDFGETIHQTMLRLPHNSALRKNAEMYVASQRGAFGSSWSEEGVWTLLALQNQVTSRPGSGPTKKGSGFLSMLKFLNTAIETSPADHAPRMCLLSGNTHVLLDGRHLSSEGIPEEKRATVALNNANDLRYPPNPAAARTLSRFFPGTLVAVQFHVSLTNHFNPVQVSHERPSEDRRTGFGQAHAAVGADLLGRRMG
ncbi:hypothetical protein [Longimicrobium terrae]|uniref:Uncharacterized protein n=1 Tax=Longimicrobium terrae TaxID=1639882 RepID=A0A841H1Q0_9BACT|nr:hypothetical protein [Longimicrobium terrae]MBB4637501.1 hypothetical protein [Longimicrobium terrae]MBB6071898.1 hypothetical protein [Longimicrobium terrae]NNC30448.1 hypothetical protein [Longimicrobium terrae]